MSEFLSASDDMDGTESGVINMQNTPAVSGLCFIYDGDEKY